MSSRASTGWAVTVLMAAVGCGRVSEAPDSGSGAGAGSGGGDDHDEAMVQGLAFARSGTRLVALGYSSNEARLFQTFHDSKLGFDCDFVPGRADAAEQRCVPSHRIDVVYTDAACTEPAAWVERFGLGRDAAEGDAVSSALSDLSQPCPGAAPANREAFRLGEQLTEEVIGVPDLPLYARRDSRCEATGAPAKVTPPVYRLIPLAEDGLARAKQVSLDLGQGLRWTRLIADDGAELSLGVTNDARTACEFQRDGECVDAPIARPSPVDDRFWAALNADCTAPAFELHYPTSCGPAKYGVEDDGVHPLRVWSLERAPALFGLDYVQPITDPLTYRCNPRSPDNLSWAAAPGAELTGTLPTASKLRRGTGPLYVDWFSVGQNELAPVQNGFVNDAGQPCQVLSDQAGAQRCVTFRDDGLLPEDLTTFPMVSFGPL